MNIMRQIVSRQGMTPAQYPIRADVMGTCAMGSASIEWTGHGNPTVTIEVQIG